MTVILLHCSPRKWGLFFARRFSECIKCSFMHRKIHYLFQGYHRAVNHNRMFCGLPSKWHLEIIFSSALFTGLLCSLFSKTEIFNIMMCVSCNPFISKVLCMPISVRTWVLRKQRERGVFMQNTRAQIHFRDSLFVGKISISSCCSAGKETKKLLASVSTSASREWLLVEVAGIEPASCDGITPASTCLFRLQCLSSRNLAGGRAVLWLFHNSESRQMSMDKFIWPGRCRRCQPIAPVWGAASPHQAASAYSSFAVIVLIEFLRGQRSSSTCR